MTNANGVRQLFNWGNAWGLHVKNNNGFYPDENGKIQCEWFDPRAKEMVEFLNKLVKDGLLDLEFATNNQDQMVSKVIRNIAGAVIDWQEFIPMWNNKLKEAEVSDANWVMTALPQGPNGYHGHIETSGIGYGAVSITKDCKNPEAAFRWLDYVMYNPENCRRLHLGVEGISYVVENGQIKMTDFVLNNPDGLGPVEAIRSLGAWTSMPNVNRAEYIKLFKITDQEMLERTKLVEPYIIPRAEFGMPTDEEFERINRKLTDIATYRDEMVTKFILGQEPLDKWDAFLNEMKAMGIDEVLEVRQAQYDRLMTN